MRNPKTSHFLRWLRWVSLIEGCSTIVLLGIAVPLKYFADLEVAVSIAGPIHGGLFLAVVAMFAIAVWRVPISSAVALSGSVAAVLPFGPFVFDHFVFRQLFAGKADAN